MPIQLIVLIVVKTSFNIKQNLIYMLICWNVLHCNFKNAKSSFEIRL